jgi:hypothetical protein
MSSKDKVGNTAAASKHNAGPRKSADVSGGAALDEDAVREYLKDNGDFLQRNPDLLDHLHVSHASGSAVSLVEKQVSVLRERNVDLRHKLGKLTRNAKENDKLFEQTRALVVKLLEADSVGGLHRAFMNSMQNGFDVEYASMILYGDSAKKQDYRVESLDKAKSEVGALLSGRKAVCGALRREEFNFLFASSGNQSIHQGGSAAIMPLSDGGQLGLIAVGSSDANHYNSAMGTLFLSHIADVILRLLPRLSQGEA